MGILIGIALNLQTALGSMAILIILILPVPKHGISFYFFVLFSVFFISLLQFSEYRIFTSLVKFIPKYFILFDVILNGIFFFYFFLIVHYYCIEKQPISVCYSCILLLLNSLISYNTILVETLGFSIQNIMSSANSGSFTYSHLIRMHFFSLPDGCGQDFQYYVKQKWQEGPLLFFKLVSWTLLKVMKEFRRRQRQVRPRDWQDRHISLTDAWLLWLFHHTLLDTTTIASSSQEEIPSLVVSSHANVTQRYSPQVRRKSLWQLVKNEY